MRNPITRISLEEETKDRWLISYADLMTLLLALFIVMYAANDKKRAAEIAESFDGQTISGKGILPGAKTLETSEKNAPLNLLKNPILIEKTTIRKTKRGVVVSLSEAGFFASGNAVIDKKAGDIIALVAKSIRNDDSLIRIEGHTDSAPISTAQYSSNWELSTARASSVLRKLIELGIKPKRLSAAGYGGFQPIAKNETPAGRAQNRRVDIVILKPQNSPKVIHKHSDK